MNLGLVVAVVCSAFLLVYCMVLQSNVKALVDKLDYVAKPYTDLEHRVSAIEKSKVYCCEQIDAMRTVVMALEEEVKILKTKPQPKPKKSKQ